MSEGDPLVRSKRDLAAARLLAGGGFAGQAVSGAYDAAFHAAEASLIALGETRSKHSGVITAFNRLVVQRSGLDPQLSDQLRQLFERRNEADYAVPEVPHERAEEAIATAERFILAVEAWLARRDRA